MDKDCNTKLLQLINALEKDQSLNYFKKINNPDFFKCGVTNLRHDINNKIDDYLPKVALTDTWIPQFNEIKMISTIIKEYKSTHLTYVQNLYMINFGGRVQLRYCCQ